MHIEVDGREEEAAQGVDMGRPDGGDGRKAQAPRELECRERSEHHVKGEQQAEAVLVVEEHVEQVERIPHRRGQQWLAFMDVGVPIPQLARPEPLGCEEPLGKELPREVAEEEAVACQEAPRERHQDDQGH